jgi:uncharacterized protein
MSIELHIQVTPEEAQAPEKLQVLLQSHPDINFPIAQYVILKRSIDARQRAIKVQLKIWLTDDPKALPPQPTRYDFQLDERKKNPEVVIVGAGPAGLFASLQCLRNGIKPILIERGKDVQKRRRDLANIHKQHIVNPESNYCFGEGGAGTYSDGKLYTRSTKRGDIQEVLDILVQFGASNDIRVDAHPHIGTNKLPGVVSAMREQIIAGGGEVHFECKLTDIIIENGTVTHAVINNNKTISVQHLILATGHSARDIFQMLFDKKLSLEFKPFALGVRVEHPQQMIDRSQYHCDERGPYLPPAAYSLVEQVEGKGVYSFCMCPGGIIAPCATSPYEVVTNGWSPSKRNNPWANSGMVVTVEWEDIPEYHGYGPLAGLEFQRQVEKTCWEKAGKTQQVPAQRIVDFLNHKPSADLPECSYQPGLTSIEMDEVLPEFIAKRLRSAFIQFGKKIKGFSDPNGLMVAPESRTSSPVRIPRDTVNLHHTQCYNLYPCAEGAGYAGGIVSAAIDGIKVANAILHVVNSKSND